MNLLIPEQTLASTLALASRGHALSRIISLGSPPAVLVGPDPEISEVTEHDDPWWSDFPGLRVTLAGGTKTLADIPSAALAAIGLNVATVPRSVKPWLAPASGQTDHRAVRQSRRPCRRARTNPKPADPGLALI